jgi:hypothetical protein
MAGLLSFVTLHVRVVLALSARVIIVVDIHVLAQFAGLFRFKVILHLPTPYFFKSFTLAAFFQQPGPVAQRASHRVEISAA